MQIVSTGTLDDGQGETIAFLKVEQQKQYLRNSYGSGARIEKPLLNLRPASHYGSIF